MDAKKSKRANLENKRSLFFNIGLIVSLGLALIAFEWKSEDSKNLYRDYGSGSTDNLILPPVTFVNEPIVPPPPRPLSLAQLVISKDFNLPDDGPDFASSDYTKGYVVDINSVKPIEEDDETIPFYAMADKPEFTGGMLALQKFIAQNVNYPIICVENGIQGMVVIAFVIDKAGEVTDVTILRGVDKNLDAEAMRVIKLLPDWKPGKQNGKPVKVSYQIPVRFSLAQS